MTNLKKLSSQFMPVGKQKDTRHVFCKKCRRDGQRCRCAKEEKEAEEVKYDQLTDWERDQNVK